MLGGLCILLGLWKARKDVIYGNSLTWMPNIISNCRGRLQLPGLLVQVSFFRYLIWRILNLLASSFVFGGRLRVTPVLGLPTLSCWIKANTAGVFCDSRAAFMAALPILWVFAVVILLSFKLFFHAIEFAFDLSWE